MKTILVPVDFNSLATAALEYAAELARRSGATLIVMYADTFEPPAEFTSQQAARLVVSIRESRRRTEEELLRYAHEHVPETVALRTEVRDALAVPAILAAIAEHQPDLVVMGTHGRGGLARLLFGSVTGAVLRETNAPVLTINRVDAARPPKEIVCARSSDAAQRVADLFGAQCRMVPEIAPHEASPVLHV